MLNTPKEKLIELLNPYCKQALQRASEICIEQSGYEVVVAHFLQAFLEADGSQAIKLLVNSYIDIGVLGVKIRKSYDRMRRGSTELPQFSPILLELLQDALLVATAELDEQEITTGAVIIAITRNADRYAHFYFVEEFASLSEKGLITGYKTLTKGTLEGSDKRAENVQRGSSGAFVKNDSALAKYGRDLTGAATKGEIDPVFCRDQEIALMIDILCRRRKNNPILVGDPGVGKTAVAEGLAIKIINDDVPSSLLNAKLWELDLGSLQAGASVKGEFERRLKAVLEEVQLASEKIVLFIDEAHALIGGGGNAGGGDAANLLKPALARGGLRAIAATTWSEYKKYFEKDVALARRFQLVKLDEPSPESTVTILRGMRDAYEAQHNVYITDAALYAAATLSARYLTGRQLPDKALDVLDTASVRVASSQTTKPRYLDHLEKRIAAGERAEAAISRDRMMRTGDGSSAAAVSDTLMQDTEALRKKWGKEQLLVNEIFDLRRQVRAFQTEAQETDTQTDDRSLVEIQGLIDLKRIELASIRGKQTLVDYEVGPEAIATVISDWTGVPVSAMSDEAIERVLNLGGTIRAVVKGQDEALAIIHDRLKAAQLDLVRADQPRGVFLLVGPSGVGKTETALQIAHELFGGKQFLTTINMSEYQEKHTVSRLIGSPPGYVGFGEGGVLTEAIRKKPYSVVLLDEVEKAHPDIMNLFYQAFDKGEVYDGEGREIDCKNIVFFMTSNLGSDAIMQNKEAVETATNEALETAIRPHLTQHFKPALLGRMRILVYRPLSDEVIRDIIHAKLWQQAARFREKRGIEFSWDDATENAIAGLCEHANNGARMVEQVITRWLIPPVADETLVRMTNEQPLTTVEISVEDGGFSFKFLPAIEAKRDCIAEAKAESLISDA